MSSDVNLSWLSIWIELEGLGNERRRLRARHMQQKSARMGTIDGSGQLQQRESIHRANIDSRSGRILRVGGADSADAVRGSTTPP